MTMRLLKSSTLIAAAILACGVCQAQLNYSNVSLAGVPHGLPTQAGPFHSPSGMAKQSVRTAQLVKAYGDLPLRFEPNQGQTDARVKFLSRDIGHTLFLTPNEMLLVLRKPDPTMRHSSSGRAASAQLPDTVVLMKLVNASQEAIATGLDTLAGTSNYFIGKDPAKWRPNIPTYSRVRLSKIYPGIDLVYYGNGRQLEYDFEVAPGADPNRIAMEVPGVNLAIDAEGNAILHSKVGEIRLLRPRVYQQASGQRKEIRTAYLLKGHVLRVAVGSYDRRQPLTIDPILAYSTYLGGSSYDSGSGIAVDSTGNAYITGFTGSADFPITSGASQSTNRSGNAFVTKLNSSGSALVYSTYLGGSGGDDQGTSIAVDSSGDAYVVGLTNSTNFPTFSSSGSTIQSTYGGAYDAFITELNPTGSALVYSTYLGGSQGDYGNGIALDSSGDVYVTGYTGSTDFPTAAPLQSTLSGSFANAFVAKLNSTGTALLYSTYLGDRGVPTTASASLSIPQAMLMWRVLPLARPFPLRLAPFKRLLARREVTTRS